MLLLPVVLPSPSTSDKVSAVPTCASTYALIDCCVASFVALLLAMLSSSAMSVIVTAPVPDSPSNSTVPVTSIPVADTLIRSTLAVCILIELPSIVKSPVPVSRIKLPVPL